MWDFRPIDGGGGLGCDASASTSRATSDVLTLSARTESTLTTFPYDGAGAASPPAAPAVRLAEPSWSRLVVSECSVAVGQTPPPPR